MDVSFVCHAAAVGESGLWGVIQGARPTGFAREYSEKHRSANKEASRQRGQQGRVIVFAAPPPVCRFELLDGETGHRLSLHAGREATALDRNRRIVVVSNGLPEMIRRGVAHAGSLPEEASSTSHLPEWIEIV